jgi:DNA-binding MarR family transcriptional regulator
MDRTGKNAPGSDLDVGELRGAFHAVLRSFGLLESAQTPCGQPIHVSLAHGLMELLSHPGCRQVDLGQALRISKSATSRLVSQMVRKGWATRTADERDGRAWQVSLTANGARVARQIDAASLERFAAVNDAIPARQRSSMCRALTVLGQAMATSRGAGSP